MDHHIPILKRKHHKFVDHTKDTRTTKIIYFAVATTGFLGQNGQICQIAAKDENDENPWSVNILPNGKFVPFASSYNGFTSEVSAAGVNYLRKDGHRVAEVCTLMEGLKKFITYVTERADNESTIMLVGWYSQEFHMLSLLQALKECRLSFRLLEDAGICYGDPYLLVKNTKYKFPQLAQVTHLKLPILYEHLYKTTILGSISVDACRNIEMLQSVMSSLKITHEDLKNYSFTISSADGVRRFRHKVKCNLMSMKGKLYSCGRVQEGITKSMAKKIAESGINYRDLKKVYQKGGQQGLERLLKAPLPQKEGDKKSKPRVTKCTRVIDTIANYFESRRL